MYDIAILVVVLIILIWAMRGSSNNPITEPDTVGFGVPYIKPLPVPLSIGGSCLKSGGKFVVSPADCKSMQRSINPDNTCAVPVCADQADDQMVFTNIPTGADATVRLPKASQQDCSAIGGIYVNGDICQTYMIKKSNLNPNTKYYGFLASNQETPELAKNKVSGPIGTFFSDTADGCAGGKYDPTTKICSFNWYSFATAPV